jgi:hypothetical protein
MCVLCVRVCVCACACAYVHASVRTARCAHVDVRCVRVCAGCVCSTLIPARFHWSFTLRVMVPAPSQCQRANLESSQPNGIPRNGLVECRHLQTRRSVELLTYGSSPTGRIRQDNWWRAPLLQTARVYVAVDAIVFLYEFEMPHTQTVNENQKPLVPLLENTHHPQALPRLQP